MKRHFAVFILLGLVVSGTSHPELFAQQRSGGPAPGTVQAPVLTPAQQDAATLRQAQDLLQRMRNTQNMPESERANMLRELERAMAQLKLAQEVANLVIAGDALNGGQLIARRSVRADGGTNAWWTNANLVARLGLSDDQKTRIERAFEASRQNLTTTRDQLEKEEAQLSKLLAADSLDRGSIATQINRVIQARGEMERVNSLMTLEMRGVLTSAQWSQLQVQNSNAVVIVNPVPPGGAAVPGLGIRGGGGGIGIGQRGGPRGGAPAPAPPNQ